MTNQFNDLLNAGNIFAHTLFWVLSLLVAAPIVVFIAYVVWCLFV